MYNTLKPVLQQELAEIKEAGLYKTERIITSPQGADIMVQGGKEVINFCANNYLGLSSHPKVIEAAKERIFNGSKTINEIAFELGFKYPQHFSRVFKQRVGQSPNEYRILKDLN